MTRSKCFFCGQFCRLEESGLADPTTKEIISNLEMYDIDDKLLVVCKNCL